MNNITIDLEKMERFLRHVKTSNGCWLWAGAKSKQANPKFSYGVVRVIDHNEYAHRFFWELLHGPLQHGECVLHSCDVPLCVRPSHLWKGTQLQNIQDRDKKNRGKWLRGENVHSSKLTIEKVLEIRERYSQGGITQVELGKVFGVSHRAIGNIIHRKVWKHI